MLLECQIYEKKTMAAVNLRMNSLVGDYVANADSTLTLLEDRSGVLERLCLGNLKRAERKPRNAITIGSF